MKNFTLPVLAMLLIGNIANAFDRGNGINANLEPITFTERGIEFLVFADGQIDFNTRPNVQDSYYYRHQSTVNSTFGAIQNEENYGVLVQHDNFGRVRRIGNVYLNYDAQNRIKRIGSVYMRYNRFGLTNIGGMQIHYNLRGEIVNQMGSVHYRMPQQMQQTQQYTSHYYGPANNQDYYYRPIQPKK